MQFHDVRATIIRYQKDVRRSNGRIVDDLGATNHKPYPLCRPGRLPEFRFDIMCRCVERKHEREMHSDPSGLRVVLGSKGFDPSTVEIVEARIRHYGKLHLAIVVSSALLPLTRKGADRLAGRKGFSLDAGMADEC